MAANQDPIILEEGVQEDMEDQTEIEIPEMTEVEERDMEIMIIKIATADVVDGNHCKT